MWGKPPFVVSLEIRQLCNGDENQDYLLKSIITRRKTDVFEKETGGRKISGV